MTTQRLYCVIARAIPRASFILLPIGYVNDWNRRRLHTPARRPGGGFPIRQGAHTLHVLCGEPREALVEGTV